PEHFLLRHWLGLSHQFEGRYPEAIQELEKAVEISRRGVSWVVGSLAGAHAAAGNRAEALRLIEEILNRAKRETIDLTVLASVYTLLSDRENALAALEKACDLRGMSGVMARIDPRLDPIRFEPRYQQVLRRMNLEYVPKDCFR